MSDLIGREVGPGRILEQIGVGGMATVYKAYHATMDRYVAIKILPEQMSQDPELRERFQREAKVIAKLEHVHILPVHEYGQLGNRLYLVMRYVEAGTLKDRLAQGPMALADVIYILHQVGGALAHAHRMGILHRDIKPSNVLLDAQGDCYLTDFGLAKIMESSVRLTGSGVGVGTPAYMSPEQGQGEEVDVRSDIYSLGVMLYEMVTGQVPFRADTPLAIVLKHISAPLPLPSSIKPDISPPLEQVILKALAKQPEFRFQTVEDMLHAFDEAVGQPITLVAPPPGMAAPRPISRPPPAPKQKRSILPWLLAGMGLVAVGATIVLAVVLVFASRWLRRQAAQVTATPSATEIVSVLASRDASGSDVSAPTSTALPGPTSSSTPTHTPSPAPTPTWATATSQPTATPTQTPTHTSTPPPTRIPSSTPTRLPAHTPSPTAGRLPAPTLIAPPDGASFQGWNARVVLQWSSVNGLASGEYYVIRIPYDNASGVAEFWRTEPSLQVPANFSTKDVGFPDRHYTWSVQVMRCTANCDKVLDDQARKQGVAVGAASAQGVFYWRPDIRVEPSPTR